MTEPVRASAQERAGHVCEELYDYHPLGTVAMDNESCKAKLLLLVTDAIMDAEARGRQQYEEARDEATQNLKRVQMAHQQTIESLAKSHERCAALTQALEAAENRIAALCESLEALHLALQYYG